MKQGAPSLLHFNKHRYKNKHFFFSYTASGEKIYNYYQWDDTRLIDVAGSYSVNGVRPAIVVDINKVQLIYD